MPDVTVAASTDPASSSPTVSITVGGQSTELTSGDEVTALLTTICAQARIAFGNYAGVFVEQVAEEAE